MIKNPGLAPGHYWFAVAVLRQQRETTDVIHEVMHFDSCAHDYLPDGFADWQAGWGHIRLDVFDCAAGA